MGQWLQYRRKYLHLLLEMEGLTKASKCSMCTSAMEVKCSDCIGGDYFCKPCCLEAHKRSPFHRISRWTGSHFAPSSLHSLEFKLCLGHNGDICSETLEVPYHIYMQFTWLRCIQGIQAAEAVDLAKAGKARKRKSKCTHTGSPLAEMPQGVGQPQSKDLDDLPGLSSTLFDAAEDFMDHSGRSSRRTRTALSGNPLLTVINQTGVFDMEIIYCICPNAAAIDVQLFQAGLFPSSFKQIETAFTFSVLDDFLADNLECKTTAQQYFSKLQSITNRMFPDSVPVCLNHLQPRHADHLFHRTFISSFWGHLANGGIWGIGWEVGLAINMRMNHPQMDPWLYFVRHVRSQVSTFQMIGRPGSHRMYFQAKLHISFLTSV